MQIGELSRNSGVNIETIRFYERTGVLPKASRKANGRRQYTDADARRLGFIRHARELGFDLAAVRTLLKLQEQPEASCADATQIAQRQLETIEGRMVRLSALKGELSRMIKACGSGAVAECRVIEALAGPLRTHGRRAAS